MRFFFVLLAVMTGHLPAKVVLLELFSIRAKPDEQHAQKHKPD